MCKCVKFALHLHICTVSLKNNIYWINSDGRESEIKVFKNRLLETTLHFIWQLKFIKFKINVKIALLRYEKYFRNTHLPCLPNL